MKARIITSVAAVGALAIVACNQDLAKSPLAPTQASFNVAPTSCIQTARANAAAYFSSPTDAVYALLTAMDQAGPAGSAARTLAGWPVLARLGAAADLGGSPVGGTPAQGSTFANSVLACMVVAGYPPAIDFSGALGPNGLFAVRDGNGNAPVTSRLIGSNGPAYGAEPGDAGNWPLAGKTLFYGSLLNLATLGNETPAGDNFELTTLPSGLTFSPEIKAGVCQLTDQNGRILHLHATDPGVILPPVSDLSFCTAATGSTGAGSSLFASAVSRMASWFAPSPANAAATRAFKAGGGGAGLVGGLSKIGPVTYTSTMAWIVPPGNTSRSTNPQFRPIVTVKNGSQGGNALAGATITLVIKGNNGSWKMTGNTAVTDAQGIATFPNLNISKPGGYKMDAVSELGGSVSVKFNIDGH